MSDGRVSAGDLFAMLNTRPGSLRRLQEATGATAEDVQEALGELEELLGDGRLGVVLEHHGAKHRIVVTPERNELVRQYLGLRRRKRLGLAATETLFFVMKHPGMSTSELAEARDIARPESTLRLLRRKGLIVSTARGEEARGRGRGSPRGHHPTKKAWALFPELEATLRGGSWDEGDEAVPSEPGAPRLSEAGEESSEPAEMRDDEAAVPDASPEDPTPDSGVEEVESPRDGSHQYLEIEVAVAGIRQHVWRRFLLSTDATFEDLHDAIQVASAEWEGYHLWEFEVGGGTIGPWQHQNADRNASEVKVLEELAPGETWGYRYDFGDDWRVDVTLRDIVEMTKSFKRKLLAGGGKWPPEDCGGPMMWRGRKGKIALKEIRGEFDK